VALSNGDGGLGDLYGLLRSGNIHLNIGNTLLVKEGECNI